MKFDSSSHIQTEVAKAFSSIWEKLTHLEEQNKQLQEENEALRRQYEQLLMDQGKDTTERHHIRHPHVETGEASIEDEVSDGEQQPQVESTPKEAWQHHHDNDDELYDEERYAHALLKLEHRNGATQHHQQKRRTPRSPQIDEISVDDNISLGLMSPSKIIENDRLVRVKMFEEAFKEQNNQQKRSSKRRARSRSRSKSRTPRKKRGTSSYLDDSDEDGHHHVDRHFESPNRRQSRTPRGDSSSKRLVPGSKLKSRDYSSFVDEAYSRSARQSPRGVRRADQTTGSKNSATSGDLELPVVKRITVFRNGDVHHQGEDFTLNMQRFTSFYQFVQLLNEKMYMGTPIRKLFEVPDHARIRSLDDLRDRQVLIAVGGEMSIKSGHRYPSKIRMLREQYCVEQGIPPEH
eukprot:CAMPEP_0117455014 /NCGR_PEP_ID=MMETSP0759-20121206/11126_1 /TAXON_ID=63605 /ORGANISM="Percolomonas cosmopolitus, Strain WS" /LENGTH=404 /DNA_ID=CAMNT_0005248275 /DNA_START=102 /DNA_END=1316 /DNA_ORIENTATION=-